MSIFCEAIVIEYLPTGIFSDPFELQCLVGLEVFLSASIFGDTNLELPVAFSYILVIENHINVKSDAQKIVVQLPLHSKYPMSLEFISKLSFYCFEILIKSCLVYWFYMMRKIVIFCNNTLNKINIIKIFII
ncbi:hypothetical protein MA16_Dca014770 [Dendrobium catenatum]|uniref:Uncharacterized protein n=1 Tax=Dendrobium catenatum TaxID=906689 RepID=A0A2I0W668_9ASPA|nr:hypothetical protein MA16_Dca014770 [Dendrobium catenatum]